MLDDHSLTVLKVVFLSIGTKPMYHWRPCIFVCICCNESKERQHLEVYTNTILKMCVCTHMCAHYGILHTVKLFYYYLQAYFMCWKYNVSTTFNVLFLLVALFGVISEHNNFT